MYLSGTCIGNKKLRERSDVSTAYVGEDRVYCHVSSSVASIQQICRQADGSKPCPCKSIDLRIGLLCRVLLDYRFAFTAY